MSAASLPGLIDEFLPRWHYNEVHAARVHASPSRVMRAIHEVSPREIRFYRGLMAIRGLGLRRSSSEADRRSLLETALRGGFLVLAREGDLELVLGAVGQFWRPSGKRMRVADPREFLAFDTPGCAKAAINFRLEDEGGGWTRVTTETRILGTDASGRRWFGAYWRVIHPGSALIRRMWLAAIKARAEASGAER